MPLFVADHRHTPATCPLGVDTRQEFLEHITAANASRHGATILAEAVPTGQHRLLLIPMPPIRARSSISSASSANTGRFRSPLHRAPKP